MTELITAEGLVRLDAALAYIDAHPEEHDQESWFHRKPGCGTTACVAGTLTYLAGAIPIWGADLEEQVAGAVVLPDGTERVISEYAAELLGVENEGRVAEALFYGAGNAAELRLTRDRLAAALVGSQESTPEATA